MKVLLRRARPLLPLLQVDAADKAVALAQTLHEAGLDVLEVALRTPCALAALSAIRKALPALCVGVGSLTLPQQFAQAKEAGAQFAVSPGFSRSLAAAAADCTLPWLPAAMTPSEVLRVREAGFGCVKLFPAAVGGAPLLLVSAVAAVFPDMQFCPTGGITAADLPHLLTLPNVPCVGGSWICPPDLIRAGDFAQIRERARQAVAFLA